MAARRSSTVEHAAQFLELLAENPMVSMSLAEIARRLGLSYASAHAIASALADVGYVRRHERTRAYSLGPGLVALATAARRGYAVIDVALPEMERLSLTLDVECHAGARSGTDMVVLARTGPQQPYGLRAQVGERLPISPPLGMAYVAWAGDDSIEAYLDRSPKPLTSSERERYREALAHMRSRGYGVVFETSERRRVGELAETQLTEGERANRDELHAAVSSLDLSSYSDPTRDTTSPVMAVTAPVFGSGGDLLIVLGLVGFSAPLIGSDVSRIAGRLTETALGIQQRLQQPS